MAINPDKPYPAFNNATGWQRIGLSLAALAYAAFSVHWHAFYLPSKHGHGTTFHGPAASLLETAVIFAAIALLLPLFADVGSSESVRSFERGRRICAGLGYALMFWGMFWQMLGVNDAAVASTPVPLWHWLLWFVAGMAGSLLGLLPASYQRKSSPSAGHKNGNLGIGGACLGSLLLLGVAVGFLWLFIYFFHANPSLLLAMDTGTLLMLLILGLGIGFAVWSWSVIRRENKAAATANPSDWKMPFWRTLPGWSLVLLLLLGGALMLTTWEKPQAAAPSAPTVNDTAQECGLTPDACPAEAKAEWQRLEQLSQASHQWENWSHGTHTIQYYDKAGITIQDGVLTVIQNSVAQDAEGSAFFRSRHEYPGKSDPYGMYNELQFRCATGEVRIKRQWLVDADKHVIQVNQTTEWESKEAGEQAFGDLRRIVCPG
ncbi:hypothetical protein [Aquitalea denitrificans]|uniref:hypothetical protein n=1 Tax=Aquitalea denitrificans TaxID=519081 RepID=UPI00135956A5|nr:hypothetical protein [Aquitalea denitrificans]